MLKEIKELIIGSPREDLFRQSCFAWVLDQTDFVENCQLIHFMLSCQIDDENDDNENVHLNYYINNDLRIQFGREEFCLVTRLRFGVEHWEEYNARAHLPFRRRVFPSILDGQTILGFDIANTIVHPTFAKYTMKMLLPFVV